MFSAAAVETEVGKNITDINGDGRTSLSEYFQLLTSNDPYTVGDADNDGDVDLTDYAMIKNYVETGEGRDDIDQQADVNRDKEYDAFDLFMIHKWLTLGAQTTYTN